MQRKLRESLRSTFKQAAADSIVPSAQDMVRMRTPYLDAVLEEILRLSFIASGNTRVTTQDVEVLGFRIPKGTDIIMPVSVPLKTLLLS